MKTCIAVLLTAVLSGCSPSTRGTKLVFAAGGAPAEVAAWKRLIATFEAAHPDLPVELRPLPADSDLQLQAMSTALGSGSAPFDLMRLDVVWLADFASRGWLEPLDAHFSQADLAPFGRLVDLLDRFQSKLLALPWNVDIGLLYSRRDLLEELGQSGPPRNYGQMLKLAAKAQAAAKARGEAMEGFVWQGKAYEGLTCNFVEAYARAGGALDAVVGQRAWSAGPASEALGSLRDLVAQGLSPANTATEMDEEGCRLLFQSGRAVFMRNWPYAAALLEGEASKVSGNVWVSPLPGRSAQGPGPGTLGGWHLAVRAGSPHAASAARLAAFLSSRESQTHLARELGWNPSRLGVYTELAGPAQAPHLAAVREALKAAVERPRLQGYAALSEKTYRAVNRVLLGQAAPSQAAAELAKP